MPDRPVVLPPLGGVLTLNPDDPANSSFVVTQADVTFNMTNHIKGTQEINVVLVLERGIHGQED